jgi:hypothetical protein
LLPIFGDWLARSCPNAAAEAQNAATKQSTRIALTFILPFHFDLLFVAGFSPWVLVLAEIKPQAEQAAPQRVSNGLGEAEISFFPRIATGPWRSQFAG